ncbi:adenosylmethionine decarboxylase [Novosphingobium naphthalenivorans]|uniref:adenosylmethionine decarboxylase n=1 Tax=Novosphingobium naphthalenivorans TaxID=273168 RepID=UPI0009FC929D|nr:adenosylmethionine decarboxylase [Novosphingobium naphthalenivorans]
MAHQPDTSLHLVADLGDCTHLGDLAYIDACLREAASAARATVLDVRLHHFGDGMGVTGVALLAESHISIHTWPEHGIAAIDLFVCGKEADAAAGLEVIRKALHGTIRLSRTIERLGMAIGDQTASETPAALLLPKFQ